ncbi:hypothetical protein [Verrucosispora sp. TAA-831]|uniref:hypothetical protein n=1 Tax=Verrucosispora sp. TAA-831 TaxID=3422227 RepID=UPI003D6EC80A
MPKNPKKPQFGTPVARCRLNIVCDGATTGLELRPVKVGEATTFARACEACADHSANTPAPVEVTS